jgi:tetratricopeptide (TPR) repeat protein
VVEPRHRRRAASATNHGNQVLRHAALGSFGVAVLAAPQMLAGAVPWAASVIAALSVAALLLAWLAARDTVEARVPPLAVVALVVLAWTALQALSLPCGLVEALAPPSAEHGRAVGSLLGMEPLCTLTRAPGATRWKVLEGIAIVSMLMAAHLLSQLYRRRTVLMVVAASPLLVMVVSLGHLLAGVDAIFGVYEPRHGLTRPLPGPIVNPNAMGGFLAMGVPLLAALGLREGTDKRARAAWLAAAGTCGVGAVLTLSRGAIASLAAGLMLLTLLVVWRSRVGGGKGRHRVLWWLGGLGAVIVAVGAHLALDAVAREFTEGHLGKLELARRALGLVRDNPWLGVGRGGFAAAFVETGAGGARYRATHPENLVVQWVTEWGLPVALVLLAAILWSLARVVGERPSRTTLGGVAAVLALGLHDLVDLSLELVGIAVVGAALLGCITGAGARRDERRGPGPRATRVAGGFLAVGAPLAVWLALAGAGPTVAQAEEELAQAFSARDAQAFDRVLREAARLHPSEPSIALLAATQAVRSGQGNAGRWLNRVMALAPTWPQPHALAGRWLWSLGAKDQALLELREAATRSPDAVRIPLCAILQQQPEEQVVYRMLPDDPAAKAHVVQMAIDCVGWRSPLAESLDGWLVEHAAARSGAVIRQARRLERERKHEEAAALLRKAHAREPHDVPLRVALARALIRSGSADEATRLLEGASARDGSELHEAMLLEALAQAYAAEERRDDVHAIIDRLRGMAEGRATHLADTLTLLGHLEARMGNLGSALEAMEAAHRLDPAPSRLLQVAEAARALGAKAKARDAYQRLCREAPSHPDYCRRLETLRKQEDRTRLEGLLGGPGGAANGTAP